jgi:hypothetical protein
MKYELTWSSLRKMFIKKPRNQANIQRVLGLQAEITVKVPLRVFRTVDWKFVKPLMMLRNDLLAQKFLYKMEI